MKEPPTTNVELLISRWDVIIIIVPLLLHKNSEEEQQRRWNNVDFARPLMMSVIINQLELGVPLSCSSSSI